VVHLGGVVSSVLCMGKVPAVVAVVGCVCEQKEWRDVEAQPTRPCKPSISERSNQRHRCHLRHHRDTHRLLLSVFLASPSLSNR